LVKFKAQGSDGLIDRKAPGQPPWLNDAHRAALAAIIENGPIPAIHGVVRWRIVDLRQWIFRVAGTQQTLRRVLRKMGYRRLSARPRHHAQAEGAIEDFKKSLTERLEEIRREKDVAPNAIEVWFADVPRQAQDEGARRPEEQDHPPVDQARNASERARRAVRRSGRLASLRPTDRPAQYRMAYAL
jgi:transposase